MLVPSDRQDNATEYEQVSAASRRTTILLLVNPHLDANALPKSAHSSASVARLFILPASTRGVERVRGWATDSSHAMNCVDV